MNLKIWIVEMKGIAACNVLTSKLNVITNFVPRKNPDHHDRR